MFSCDLKESRLGKVYIENISPWTMKRLLDFMYTSIIEINQDNIIEIFNAAIMFNLYNLVEKCTIYIQEHIDITNCIDLYLFADLYDIEKLKEATFNFILENFMLIYELTNHDYVKLNESTFIKLIKSENLNISNEILALQALKNWYLYASKQCTINLEALFKSIRFKSINGDELINLINSDSFMNENKDLITTTLNNCLYKTRPSTVFRDYLCVLNRNKFEIYDFYKSKWSSLPNWPPSEQTESVAQSVEENRLVKLNAFSTCILNNNLYLTGGIDPDTNRLSNQVWKYEAIKNKWKKCAPMFNERAYHLTLNLQSSVNELNNDFIFVFYGITNKRRTIDDNGNIDDQMINNEDYFENLYEKCKIIEYYNIDTDSWFVLTLPNTLSNYHLFELNSQYDIRRFICERDKLIRKKSIISLRNIIYILQNNSIHCYQFSTKSSQFICLPYFRLPDNLINNNFILLKAIEKKAPSAGCCLSSFSWISSDSEANADENENDENFNGAEEINNKREVLIFLANLDEKLIYEFYPARNKLKKLPNLLLKHSINDTFVLEIKSNIYLTGGLNEDSIIQNESENEQQLTPNNVSGARYGCIEKFDYETNNWEIFMDCIESLNINNVDHSQEEGGTFVFPLTNNLFKLKMSI